jgi:hypothetical protein
LENHLGAPKPQEELSHTDSLAKRAVVATPGGGGAICELMGALERLRTDRLAPLGFLTNSKAYRPSIHPNSVGGGDGKETPREELYDRIEQLENHKLVAALEAEKEMGKAVNAAMEQVQSGALWNPSHLRFAGALGQSFQQKFRVGGAPY